MPGAGSHSQAEVSGGPALTVSLPSCEPGPSGVGVHRLGPASMAILGRYVQAGGLLRSILGVSVAQDVSPPDGTVPDVSGHYRLSDDGIWFEPHFPFERGLPYVARFDPRPLGAPGLAEVLTLAFSSAHERSSQTAEVKRIFPTSDI